MSQYQKGKTNLDFTEARDSEWQWHQLGHMQVGISLQTDNYASTPPLKFFTGRMPFLPPNQQRQSTEDVCKNTHNTIKGKGKRTPTDLMSLQAGEANSEQVTLAGTTFGKANGDLPTFRSSWYHFPLQL